MKIENIIDDIKTDMQDLRERLEEQFKLENPGIHFSVSLPGIEELATVKALALSIEEGNEQYCLTVQIHTHNGNRVFEMEPKRIINNEPLVCSTRHPFQDRFVNLLRDIIKKKKGKAKGRSKPARLYNDFRQYANTG